MADTGFKPSILSTQLTGKSRRYLVAFSGGGDSTALLHGLTQLDVSVRAVHVNHALQPRADAWARHCAELCAAWNVPLAIATVRVDNDAGQGMEAAARDARYRALGEQMKPGECLLTAHTKDDQAETVLLQLLRGTGLKGLAGMAAQQSFGAGTLLRPLLHVSRNDLRDYLRRQDVAWLDDPDNANLERSRVYLRTRVMPLLAERWPAAVELIARAAINLREANEALDEYSGEDLARLRQDDTIALDALNALPPGRRRLVLRQWIADRALPSPSRAHLHELEAQLAAADDAELCVTWPGAVVRRYRDRLHADAPHPEIDPELEWRWHSEVPLDLGHGLGGLALETANIENSDAPNLAFDVRLRRGGERIRIEGRKHSTELKTLLQEMGVAPWQRGRVPLLFQQGKLVAIADWRVSDELAQILRRHNARLIWRQTSAP